MGIGIVEELHPATTKMQSAQIRDTREMYRM
jgi:hypothetical protein